MLHLGVDRFATVLTCVVATALIGGVFANRSRPAALGQTAAHLSAETLRHLAGQPDLLAAEALLAKIAGFDDTLDPHGAGSSAARRAVHTNRRLLLMLGDLMLSAHDLTDAQPAPPVTALPKAAMKWRLMPWRPFRSLPIWRTACAGSTMRKLANDPVRTPLRRCPCTRTASARASPSCAQAA